MPIFWLLLERSIFADRSNGTQGKPGAPGLSGLSGLSGADYLSRLPTVTNTIESALHTTGPNLSAFLLQGRRN